MLPHVGQELAEIRWRRARQTGQNAGQVSLRIEPVTLGTAISDHSRAVILPAKSQFLRPKNQTMGRGESAERERNLHSVQLREIGGLEKKTEIRRRGG